ncbi:unnamed protein product [Sphenostylis stenocarpa]|uniref:Uncharacterized protein n=1 Tax=Sphenostylis stenocarpa TaxID=92480 RepID=A0AA86S3A6_9FABA|nr:unnamed protein product [Sphenostylis stenocarpa]
MKVTQQAKRLSFFVCVQVPIGQELWVKASRYSTCLSVGISLKKEKIYVPPVVKPLVTLPPIRVPPKVSYPPKVSTPNEFNSDSQLLEERVEKVQGQNVSRKARVRERGKAGAGSHCDSSGNLL